MAGSRIDLSKYRFQKAQELLRDAELLFKQGSFESSVNRSYYAMFHALRSVTVLDGFESSKHSGIIAYFNKNYIKTGTFEKHLSKIIDNAFRLRDKADYDDFITISLEKAEEQIENAKLLIDAIKPYLEKKWDENKENM